MSLKSSGEKEQGGEGIQPKERMWGHYNITLHSLIEISCLFFGFIETQHTKIFKVEMKNDNEREVNK
jgi:hypothetical protein